MKIHIEKISFAICILGLGLVLSGTKACREDYFFATQVDGVATSTPDPTEEAVITLTPSVTATETPSPTETAEPAATLTAVPTSTIAPTATVATAALLNSFSFKDDLPDDLTDDNSGKKSVTAETVKVGKVGNWLGNAFTDNDTNGKDDADNDSDGYSNGLEANKNTDPDNARSYPFYQSSKNYLKSDADRDGIEDTEEENLGTDKSKFDSDGDGCGDGIEGAVGRDPLSSKFGNKDSDSDCLPDSFESKYKLNPGSNDTDFDGLNDGNEVAFATNPLKRDTDGDGISDSEEHLRGFDPTNPNDPVSN